MSGHSKWHNIQKKKGAADSQRAVQFAKIAKLISVAARGGGGDSSFNFALRMAIDSAKGVNMPKDNIDRAIKNGTGELGSGTIEENLYEGFGPGGSALLIKSLTDNRNRAISEIRTIINKNGGTIGGQGSVAWMFEKKGVVTMCSPLLAKEGEGGGLLRDEFELAVIDVGADDIVEDGDVLQVLCAPDQLKKVTDAIELMKIKVDGAEIEYRAKELIAMSDPEVLVHFEKMMEVLDELEDVDTVYTNIK